MKKALVLAALLASAANLAVAAEDFGFYVYGALGKASLKVDQAGTDSAVRSNLGASQVSSSSDDNPTAIKLQMGYQFDSSWAIEGGYAQVDKLTYSGTARVGSSNVSGSLTDKLSIWNAVAAVTLPLGSTGIQGTGRIGVASVRESYGISGFGLSLGVDGDSKTSLTYGLGVKYNFNKNVSVRADMDHYKAADDDFNIWSVGAGYKF